MFIKEIILVVAMISTVIAIPVVVVDPNANPQIQPLGGQVAQARTFGSLFGSGYSTNYRYPDSQRGYPNYGASYSGSVYGNSASVVPQQVVPGYGGAYGGYGWRGGSDNRGYGAQSGWVSQAQSGWSGNYGR